VETGGGAAGFWKLLAAGMLLLLAGMGLIIMAALLYIARGGKAEVGGVVMIGPIPIVFGTSGDAVKVAAIAAVALMVLAVIVMYVLPAVLARNLAKMG